MEATPQPLFDERRPGRPENVELRESKPRALVRIAILSNDVSVDGVGLALADRESELLTLLALCGGYAETQRLVSLMWPGVPLSASFKSLWSALTHLRASLPDPDLLASEKGGYRLHADVSLDVCEIGSYLRAHRFSGRSRASVDTLVYELLDRFAGAQRWRVARWAWSEPLLRRIDAYRRDAGMWLCHDLLSDGCAYEAYRVVSGLVGAFPASAAVQSLAEDVERRLVATYVLTSSKPA